MAIEKCMGFEFVCLYKILTFDIVSNVFLWFLTRSLLKETGTLESQLEANKVSNVYSLPKDIPRSTRKARKKCLKETLKEIILGKFPSLKVKSLRLLCQPCQKFAF